MTLTETRMTDAELELDKTGPITDDEAEQIARRYNVSHWHKGRKDGDGNECARYSIPVRPDRDDDIRLGAYIKQTRALRAELKELRFRMESLEK